MIRSAMLLGVMALTVAGCTNYYHVKDPTTGRDYYTRMIWDKPGGGISFEDAASGRDVTLQNSEVGKVTSDQYDAVRRHRVEVDDDHDVLYVRPAGANVPSPDRQIIAPYQQKTYRDGTIVVPDDDAKIEVHRPAGSDVHIDVK